MLTGIKWTLLYAVITFILLEGFLWVLGYRPYRNHDYRVDSTPQTPFVADEKLGIQLNEGTFDFTLNDAVRFTATHLDNGMRKIPGSPVGNDSSILFLGCSYTYGYGVNDHESFPAIAQSRHPEWNVENKGVVGYGTTQHLIQLRDRLKISINEVSCPKCVVLCLSSVHFIRTVLSKQYRSNLRIGYRRSSSNMDDRMNGARFPYIDNTQLVVKYADWASLYNEVPGRYWLASANFLQGLLQRSRESKCDPVKVTAAIIEAMHALCSSKNIPFGVACLNTSHETKKLQGLVKNIAWINVGFSFKNKSLTHFPHDSHPNAAGHAKIAVSVIPFIENMLKP